MCNQTRNKNLYHYCCALRHIVSIRVHQPFVYQADQIRMNGMRGEQGIRGGCQFSLRDGFLQNHFYALQAFATIFSLLHYFSNFIGFFTAVK